MYKKEVNIKNILNKPMQIQNSQNELIRLDSQPKIFYIYFKKLKTYFLLFIQKQKIFFIN